MKLNEIGMIGDALTVGPGSSSMVGPINSVKVMVENTMLVAKELTANKSSIDSANLTHGDSFLTDVFQSSPSDTKVVEILEDNYYLTKTQEELGSLIFSFRWWRIEMLLLRLLWGREIIKLIILRGKMGSCLASLLLLVGSHRFPL